MKTKHPFIDQLEEAFIAQKDSQISLKQAAYMRNLFPFLGLMKTPQQAVLRPLIKQHAVKEEKILITILESLWEKEEREFQYAALAYARAHPHLLTANLLPTLENMIRRKSWWDTIDEIAPCLVGTIVRKTPALTAEMDVWIEDDYLWIRRTAIIYQLKWKKDTDTERLFRYCQKQFHDRDFFIRKAIGWALREYSKSHPEKVSEFIQKHRDQMSPLSVREGLKWIEKRSGC